MLRVSRTLPGLFLTNTLKSSAQDKSSSTPNTAARSLKAASLCSAYTNPSNLIRVIMQEVDDSANAETLITGKSPK